MTEVTDKVESAIARFDRVTRQLDERDGPVREAARRERQRLNTDLANRVKRVGVAVLIISIRAITLMRTPVPVRSIITVLVIPGPPSWCNPSLSGGHRPTTAVPRAVWR